MGISAALGSSALVPAGFGFRNLIINGDFSVAQRGTSFTATSSANNDDTYNLDRWTLLSDTNDVVDVTQATDVPTGGLYSIGLDVETANKKFGIVQFVEQRNITGVQNKSVWLSFKARTTGSSISNVKAVVLAWTGTADAVTSDVVSAWGADGVTPTWATNWVAENTPSNLGVTNTWSEYRVQALVDTASTKNLAVFIWCDDTSTTVGDFLYITDVQLEINNVPTPFERRPIGVELALCQRYHYLVAESIGTSDFTMPIVRVSTTTCAVTLMLPVTMRANPSLVGTTSYGRLVGYDTSFSLTTANVTAITVANQGPNFNMVQLVLTNATLAGTNVHTHWDLNSASPLIGLSAEL
jgi:hypothetical protein